MLTNVAVSSLGLSSAVLGGANPGDFTEKNNCPKTLLPGGSCEFTVTFGPTAIGARGANLTIAGKDGSGALRLVVNLSGIGD
jgi:hypothetical protein